MARRYELAIASSVKVNDYDREVFNGDLGVVTEINSEDQEVTVQYATKTASYDLADLNEIALAWAITVHKSQGSEYPVVLMPLYTQHYMMLSRPLLYTGLTRAKSERDSDWSQIKHPLTLVKRKWQLQFKMNETIH